jgi:putative peptidoglycan lipid II flippase
LGNWFAAPGILARAAGLALLVGAGLAVYGIAVLATGAVRIRQLRAMLGRRGPAG